MQTITSKLLSPYKNLLHAFSTRLDGNSKYGNNLAYHVNDTEEHIDQNHIELAKYMHYPIDRLVHMNQVHGDDIVIIDILHDFSTIPSCDALITQEKNTPLMVMVADCIPILVYDPIQEVIAVVHAGRAGIFTEILPKTIEKMKNKYGCQPEDLLISLGPSIHKCCYEVGIEIKEEAKKNGLGYAITTLENKYFLDLVSIAHQQLINTGIKKDKIEDSIYCTACNTKKFYSYRAENSECGRFSGLIMLK